MKYAYMSMKTIMAMVLRQYTLSTDLKLEDLRTKFEITMKLVNKPMLKIRRRVFRGSDIL